jgi:hypothetical protein
MNALQHKEEIEDQLLAIKAVCSEIVTIQREFPNSSEPSLLVKTAAAAYIGQVYSGIENILKRISKFKGVALLPGEEWHTRLIDQFRCSGQLENIVRIDDDLYTLLNNYRRIRHVVRNAYGFEIQWDLLYPGIENVSSMVQKFEMVIRNYLLNL